MKSTIPALVLIAAACVSFTAFAAGQTEPSKAVEVQADKAEPKKMQPHSHLQEKTGMMPQKKSPKAAPEEKGNATSAATDDQSASTEAKPSSAKSKKMKANKDKSKHFHPRDGK